MLGGYGLLPEGNEWRQTQLTDKREGHRMEIMRKARVQRHKRSVLHDLFLVSIRLSSSTITIEPREPQKRNWACRAGFHEHTSVSLHVPIPNNARGGDTRVHEDTAQSRHCQRAPEPSVVGLTASTPGILHFHTASAPSGRCVPQS